MSYDRADWHYGGNFPPDLPPEAGGTHIGMFLAWAINNHLEGEIHHEDEDGLAALEAVRSRQMTGREFLFRQCDEKFWDQDLNEEGNEFALEYYTPDKALYISDYESTLGVGLLSLYHVADTWENYDKIAPVISRRFMKWKSRKSRWRFWKR
jgi:hypothetical protein